MRISDWSSDVCTSDLVDRDAGGAGEEDQAVPRSRAGVREDRHARGRDRSDATVGRRQFHHAQGSEGVARAQKAARPARRRAQQGGKRRAGEQLRSEEHKSELQSLMLKSYAVFCLKKKKKQRHDNTT